MVDVYLATLKNKQGLFVNDKDALVLACIRTVEIGICSSFSFFLMCVLRKKTKSKNTMRLTSFQAIISTNTRGSSGRMEIQAT